MYINQKGKGKHNLVKTGDVFINNKGQEAVVTDYRGATEVEITFSEDGAVRTTSSSDLRKGCFSHPHRFTSLIGKRYKNNQGDWFTIVEYKNAFNVGIVFDGYPKNIKYVEKRNIEFGSVRNNYKPSLYGVGYLGEGKYQGSEKDGTVFVYNVWSGMLARNYDEATMLKQPSYEECVVDERFHCFQNFADFYINHESYGLGYEVDKDLLSKGIKTYSPETCTMLPQEINVALTTASPSKSGLPLGVNKIDNGYVARLSKGSEGRVYLGYYKTPEEAHKVYVEAKERYVRNLALKWANRISWDTFVALMNWTVY